MRATATVFVISTVVAGAAACGGSSTPATGASGTTSSMPVTVTSTAAAPTVTATAAAPLGLAVSSVTFVSATQGWVIGTSAGHARVEETTDGGAHWSPLPAIPPGAVTGIRFADATHGYAFSREALDLTGDGGRTWRQVSLADEDTGDGTGAADVEIAAGIAWLLNAAAPYPSLYDAPIGSTAFHKVGTAGNRGATLTVQGPKAYVLGLQGAGPVAPNLVVASTTSSGRAHALPCTGGTGTGDVAGIAPLLDDRSTYLACAGAETTSSMPASGIFRSSDDFTTWFGVTVLHTCGASSVSRTGLAIYVGCRTGGIVRLAIGGASTTPELPGVPVQYVGFTNDSDGVAISEQIDSGGVAGSLYVTRDGGAQWSKAAT